MNFDKDDTAVVFIDPQNEVLSETGLAWPLVRESVQENDTIANMERIFKLAKSHPFEVFISPHYFYPTDKEPVGGSGGQVCRANWQATALVELNTYARQGHASVVTDTVERVGGRPARTLEQWAQDHAAVFR